MGRRNQVTTRLTLALGVAVLGGCAVVAGLGNDYQASADAGATSDAASGGDGLGDATGPGDGGVMERGDATVPPDAALDSGLASDAPDADVATDAPDAASVPPPPPTIDSGATDSGVAPMTLVQTGSGSNPYFVAAGAGYVAWTDIADGMVHFAEFVGPIPTPPIPASPLVVIGGTATIVYANGEFYWADEQGQIYAAPPSGSSLTSLGVVASAGTPFGVAVTTSGSVFYATTDGALVQSGFPLQNLVLSGSSTMVVSAVVVTDSTSLFWIVPQGIGLGPIDSISTESSVAFKTAQPTGITVGGGAYYWTSQSGGTIQSCTTNTSVVCAGDMVLSDQMGIANIVYDADTSSLYWTNPAAGTVSKCSVPGTCAPVTIAQGQPNPFGITTDSKFVYWTNQGSAAGPPAVMVTSKY